MKRIPLIIFLLLGVSLACNLPGTTPAMDTNTAATALAITLTTMAIQNPPAAPGLQPVALPTATTQPPANPPAPTNPPAAANQPSPTSQPTATPTLEPTRPAPTSTVQCDWAGFVSETVPDGTKVKPGETFTKSWTLKNKGSCPWTSGYSLVFDRGDQLGAPSASPLLAGSIPSGGTVQVSVTLTAPTQPGAYQGFFMLKNPSGQKFGLGEKTGQAFWVKIEVRAAEASIFRSGNLEISQTWDADLDSGVVGPASGADLKHSATNDTDRFLEFWVPTMVMRGKPSYEECKNITLMDGLSMDARSIPGGTYICYRTTEGRLGFVRFNSFGFGPGAPDTIYLEFTTWTNP